jgi:hypothetical protein
LRAPINANQQETWGTIRASQEVIITINSIQPAPAEFEETIVRWVEDIIASVSLRMQRLHKELGSEMQGTQMLIEAMLCELKQNWRNLKPKQSLGGSGNAATCMDRVREPKQPRSLRIKYHRTGQPICRQCRGINH